ncbi:MAG: DUF2470 domain-containing protein [Pseudomonadota bacterium]
MTDKSSNQKGAAALDDPAARDSRGLIRRATKAALGTIDQRTGHPYVSLVIVGTTFEGSPILLLSNLAAHTKNLKADPKASLLFEEADQPVAQDTIDGVETDPIARGRVTVIGTIDPVPEPDVAHVKQRFLSRHPSSAGYAEFADFAFYRLQPTQAHFIGGFGRIVDIPSDGLVFDTAQVSELKLAEGGIVSHMNDDHQAAINHYAEDILQRPSAQRPWKMTGMDPEGIDLARGSSSIRLPFEERLYAAQQVRKRLTKLVENREPTTRG